MAARATMRRFINLKPKASIPVGNRVFAYPGRTTTTQPLYSQATKELMMKTQIFEEWKLKKFENWKLKNFEEIARTIKEEGAKLERIEGVKLEDQHLSDARLMMIDCFRSVLDLWEKDMVEWQRGLLEAGWASLRDFLRSNGMENCHKRLMVSINHGWSGEEDVVGFATGSPRKGLTSLRCSVGLQCPGPYYELPRQAVEGVLCFTTEDAFLLYEPETGHRSPWIETTSKTRKARRQVESIALGYAPKSMKHVVVCISSKRRGRFARATEKDSEEFMVAEVLTVRANTWATGEPEWRRLKVDGLPLTCILGNRIAFMDGPVYVDGKICWLYRHNRSTMYILRFCVETQVFDRILVPKFLVAEFMDSSLHIRAMLMEIGGTIAILKSTMDQQETSSLWISHTTSESDEIVIVDWKEKKVKVPYAHISPDCSIEALKGTPLIFVQSHRLISYYNIMTEESISFEIPASLRNPYSGWGRMMQLS